MSAKRAALIGVANAIAIFQPMRGQDGPEGIGFTDVKALANEFLELYIENKGRMEAERRGVDSPPVDSDDYTENTIDAKMADIELRLAALRVAHKSGVGDTIADNILHSYILYAFMKGEGDTKILDLILDDDDTNGAFKNAAVRALVLKE